MESMGTEKMPQPQKESPIDVALGRLRKNIGLTQETMARFETTLASVMTEQDQDKQTEKGTPETQVSQTPLESRLSSMAGEIAGINSHLLEIQNRVQL